MIFARRYHEIFRLLFAPSRALALQVETTMRKLDLAPQQYSSVHMRVKYPIKGLIKEKEFSYSEHKDRIADWANNAVNCAVQLDPNSTIYVTADSNDTVGYLLEESRFAKHYEEATRQNRKPVVKLVSRDYSSEVKHVAFSSNDEISGFMDVFEDLMILGMGKCVAHGEYCKEAGEMHTISALDTLVYFSQNAR